MIVIRFAADDSLTSMQNDRCHFRSGLRVYFRQKILMMFTLGILCRVLPRVWVLPQSRGYPRVDGYYVEWGCSVD